MGKFSPKERNRKQKKRLRGSSKASVSKACTDLGRKRVAVFETEKADGDVALEEKVINRSPLMLSPVNLVRQNSFLGTPKTPRIEEWESESESESRLESLPMELLVVIARQFYFNFTTPDRSWQEMLRTMTPRPTEHWPFISKVDGKGILVPSPHTPKAPRHGPRPPSRLKASEMRQVAAVLFQESSLPASCMVPSVLAKPLCKSLASNRVLFYEDELCQAVAQNKLR